MMHSNNFVVSVKSSGKVLREFGDTVYVPFGSEFSLYLKNLNSRKALVKVSIDGEDVLNGSELVVYGNQVLELERYLKDINKGNRFKFIERTAGVEKHRGIGAEDGLIRVEFAYEKQYYVGPFWTRDYQPDWYGRSTPRWGSGTGDFYQSSLISNSFADREVKTSSGIAGGTTCGTRSAGQKLSKSLGDTQCSASASPGLSQNYGSTSVNYTAPVSDAGITVPGSESNQKFTTVSSFTTDASTVIVLKMVGDVGQNLVKEAVTVKAKQECQTCGRINKMSNKFCSECGTALVVY